MLTPYDWQEAIGHRAQYVESRLADGVPVLAASCKDGIAVLTWRRVGTRKVFEIYDRLLFSGLGLQSDVEAIRIAAIEFTHREGFARSEEDVTVQRVVAGLSTSIKRSFADFNTSPVVATCLFAEVCDTPAEDSLMVLEYDGDYRAIGPLAVVAGTEKTRAELESALSGFDFPTMTGAAALDAFRGAWKVGESTETDGADLPSELVEEPVLLSRDSTRVNRFVAMR
ncbi:MAG TPA: hypothetical protein PKA27_09510 [Fimbriimonadaceae bacterium]|nr:hypothetical protein [Fimbriimonadaceae bacterium]